MGNDLSPHNVLTDMDAGAVFAALDKVVAETPLASRHRTGDVVAEPTYEIAAPEPTPALPPEPELAVTPEPAPAPMPEPVLATTPEPDLVLSPEPVVEVVDAKPSNHKERLYAPLQWPSWLPPSRTSGSIQEAAPFKAIQEPTPSSAVEELAPSTFVRSTPFRVPAPVTSAAPIQLRTASTVVGSARTDVDEPVKGSAPVPAAIRQRNPIGVALVLLIVIAAVQAVFLIRNRPAPVTLAAAAAPVSTGTVVVESTPAGAAVVIDGQPRGKTPTTLTLAPGEYAVEIVSGTVSQRMPVTVRAGTTSTQAFHFAPVPAQTQATGPTGPAGPPTGTGTLQVSSQPSGARVSVDGSPRGVTPLTLSNLAQGSHSVVVEGPAGSARENVTLEPGMTAALKVALAASGAAAGGWVSVAAPIDVQLFEGTALLGSSQSERIMLPAGRHVIDVVNTTLGYRTTQTVQVGAGATTRLRLDVPMASVAINAVPWADVSVDGKTLGPTPLGNVSVPIGTHEIVFKHPQLGERRQTAIVTLKGPNRVSVNLNQR